MVATTFVPWYGGPTLNQCILLLADTNINYAIRTPKSVQNVWVFFEFVINFVFPDLQVEDLS